MNETLNGVILMVVFIGVCALLSQGVTPRMNDLPEHPEQYCSQGGLGC